ncbi:MAG: hypothetical protein GY699_07895 [Desulfobacteraceae bacterium]|nr:hypothetical protein [Desulfobacteraceae bacterium]
MGISIVMIDAVFKQHNTAQGYAKGITELLRGVMENDPDFFSLFFKGFAVARHSPIVNKKLSVRYGQFRKALERWVFKKPQTSK